jgi:hypothetical protein
MRIHRPSLPLALVLGALAAFGLAGISLAAETTLTADLAGDAETDADGSGSATITLDPETGEACWELSAADTGPIDQSHIHVGAAGESGDVAVPLDVDGFDGTSEGCVSDQDADVLQAIVDDPAGYYVNLHTAEFPGGAIRGQLAAGTAPPNTALPAADASAAWLGALLLGAALAIGLRIRRLAGTRA